MRRAVRSVVVPVVLSVTATVLAAIPAAAEPVPDPLQVFAWGTKPAGMVVGSFEAIQQQYWDDALDEFAWTDEPGGLAAWRRGCFYEPDCWFRLTSDPTDQSPAWSPSGYQVAFLRGAGDTRQLMVLDTRTGEERMVLSTNSSISAPTWSPDEQELAFSRKRWIEREGEEPYLDDSGLYRTGAFAGATAVRSEPEDEIDQCAGHGLGLAGVDRSNPQWAPDGRLFYLRDELALADGYCRIVSIAAWTPGSGGQEVIDPQAVTGGALSIGAHVEPSPAADRVALSVADVGSDSRIRTWPATEGTDVLLGGFGAQPSWTPDGRHISMGDQWFDAATGEELPRWVDSGEGYEELNPDLPISPGQARSYDTQCTPGNCLSGIMVVIDGNGIGLGDTVLSGAVQATLDMVNDSLLSRRQSGTYEVVATPPAGTSVTAITCDDTNSSGDVASRTATYRVDSGELVVCTFMIGQPDADADGIPDDADPCPADATNRCDDDSDGDGWKDVSDPCPADPTNTCDDPPPPPQDRCRTHNATYQAFIKGTAIPIGRFELSDVRWCSNGRRSALAAPGSAAYTDVRPASLAVLMKLAGLSFERRKASVSSQQFANGALRVTGTASVSYCTQIPVPGSVVSKGARKAFKLLPPRLRSKVADWAAKRIAKSHLIPDRVKKKIVVLGVAAVLRAAGASKRERWMIEKLVDQAYSKAAQGLLTLITKGVCVPKVWVPEIEITVDAAGAPSVSEVGTTAIFDVRPYRP